MIFLLSLKLSSLNMYEDLKKRFNEEGFVVVRDLLEPSEIEFYREVVKEAIKERKQLDERNLKTNQNMSNPLFNVKTYGKTISRFVSLLLIRGYARWPQNSLEQSLFAYGMIRR